MFFCRRFVKNREYITKAYVNGDSTGKLAKEFKCNSGTIYYALKSWGVPIREKQTKKGNISKYDKQIIKLHSQGLSAYQISKRLSFSRPGVLARGKMLGISFSGKYKLKNPVRLKDIKDKILEMYNSGISINKIEKITGYPSAMSSGEGNDVDIQVGNKDSRKIKILN